MLSSVKALLSSVVDYAGLFPPAKLDMGEAITNYARYRMTPHSWMLGHFVLPAFRMNEFENLLATLPLADGKARPWSLSLILSKNWESEMERVRSHNNSKLSIAALEIPPLPPSEIEKLLPHLPTGVDSFFEIPLTGDLEAHLTLLRGTGASAKIRTGGITAEAFPNSTQISQFVGACAAAKIAFKATAGLHHPLPGNYPLTYEPDSHYAPMHGFLNVTLLAVLLSWQKITPEQALDVLQESSIDSFQFKEDGIGWSACDLNLSEIEQVRLRFFRSFGSCSFEEPIDDLKNLNLL